MKTHTVTLSLLSALSLSVLLLTGCGSEDAPAPGQTLKTEDGRIEVDAGGDLDLPKGWPEDVPFPSDTNILMSMDLAGKGHKVTYSTKKPIADLVEWYQTGMQKNDWPESDIPDTGSSKMLTYNKDGRKVVITITDTGTDAASVIVTTYNGR